MQCLDLSQPISSQVELAGSADPPVATHQPMAAFSAQDISAGIEALPTCPLADSPAQALRYLLGNYAILPVPGHMLRFGAVQVH
jgi:hypothetical protein